MGACRAGGVCIEGAESFFPYQKISNTHGGFLGTLDDGDRFGMDVAALRDLSGNGPVGDLVGSARDDDDGGLDVGALWILFAPEPDSSLQFLTAIGVLILLQRARRRCTIQLHTGSLKNENR